MPSARRRKPAAAAAPDSVSGYRLGLAASHRGEHAAFQILNTALDVSLAEGDANSAALASSALLITGQMRANYRRFPEHIERLAIARDGNFPWLDHDEELLALAGLLAGLLFFAPTDSFLEACVNRIMMLLELDLDVNTRFAAGRLVMYYSEARKMRALGQRVYSLLRPNMDRKDLEPHRLGQWLIYWARIARYAKEPHAGAAGRRSVARVGRRTSGCATSSSGWHDRRRSQPARAATSPMLSARWRRRRRWLTRHSSANCCASSSSRPRSRA